MLTTTSPSALPHQDAQFRRLQTEQIRGKATSRQLLQLWLSALEGSIALESHVQSFLSTLMFCNTSTVA
jgi:hypothetical protein